MKEKKGYKIIQREEMIDDLIKWIGETKSENDRCLMRIDLEELMSWDCGYIYSSEGTNDYIPIEDGR